jgi:hypothetical protein
MGDVAPKDERRRLLRIRLRISTQLSRSILSPDTANILETCHTGARMLRNCVRRSFPTPRHVFGRRNRHQRIDSAFELDEHFHGRSVFKSLGGFSF